MKNEDVVVANTYSHHLLDTQSVDDSLIHGRSWRPYQLELAC